MKIFIDKNIAEVIDKVNKQLDISTRRSFF